MRSVCEFFVFEVLDTCSVRPEHRINAKFAHFVDENDKVQVGNLTLSGQRG